MQPRLERWTSLLAVLVVAAAACTQHIPGPSSPTTVAPTTVAPTTSARAAPSPPPTSWQPSPTPPPPPTVALQPGPHSKLADVDLAAGTVLLPGNASDEEDWRYTASYDDTVAFLRKQFATGPKYDTHGATRWRDLPPCYNSKYDWNTASPAHESPPQG
jgi:hypothetical protein